MIIIKLSFPYSNDNKFSIPQHQKPQHRINTQHRKMQCKKMRTRIEHKKKLWFFLCN